MEHVIVGLESLEHRAALPEIVSILGPGGTVFSLDLKRGVPITRCPEWQVTSDRGANTVPGGEVVRSGDTLHGADVAIDEIIAAVLGAGVRRLIVLDLAGVGVGAGVQALDVCRRAAQAAAAADVRLELVSGGGVRNVDDLAAMAHAGCSAALVASALHDGRIRADDLAALGE
ncbi:MAG: HisA/HisF-related TIM barrel protein [Pirellulales bacterium]